MQRLVKYGPRVFSTASIDHRKQSSQQPLAQPSFFSLDREHEWGAPLPGLFAPVPPAAAVISLDDRMQHNTASEIFRIRPNGDA